MEDSITSSSVSYSCYDSLESSASSEESGWTAYLEDLFSTPPPKRKEGDFSSTGSSMISDASWKPMLLESKCRRKLHSEENKDIRSFPDGDDDDPLEDTASSTTASLDHLKSSIETSKKDEHTDAAQEGVDCGGEKKENIANVIGFMERSNGWTDLRERGVCLIPFSQLLIDNLDESSNC